MDFFDSDNLKAMPSYEFTTMKFALLVVNDVMLGKGGRDIITIIQSVPNYSLFVSIFNRHHG